MVADRHTLFTLRASYGPAAAQGPGWRRALAPPDVTLREAIALVETMGVALVADQAGRLLGTIYDTDIRRALLGGVRPDDPARPIINAAPIAVATPGRGFDGAPRAGGPVPIVDNCSRIVGLESSEGPAFSDRLVILMAGGLGMRLRPITARRPKPLLPVGGRPLLESLIDGLRTRGFRRFLLCVGYRAKMIERHFADGRAFGVHIDYLHDRGELGTAGPLGLVDGRPDRAFLVVNGDIMTTAPFDRLLTFHDQSGADATMAVAEVDVQVPYGVVQLRGGMVDAIREKPVQRLYVNAGMYVLNPPVLDLVRRGVRNDMPAVLNALIARDGRVGAFPLHESWIDIGSHDDLQTVQARLSAGRPWPSQALDSRLAAGRELSITDR